MTEVELETVTPGDGQDLSELAASLIRLAGDNPHAVQWQPRYGHFTVPAAVAAAYAAEVVDAQDAEAAEGSEPKAVAPRAAKKATAKKATAAKKEPEPEPESHSDEQEEGADGNAAS